MHEGLSAGETKMELDVQRTKGLAAEEAQLLIGTKKPATRSIGLHTGGIVNGSSGSTGEESSSDEPALPESTRGGNATSLKNHHSHHHAVHPKKYRLKESTLGPLLHGSPRARGGRSPMPTGSGSSKDEDEEMLNIDDSNEEDDKSSGPSVKEGVSHSFTSGENSDSEMGGDGDGDGDDMLGLNKQEDLNRKVFECDVCNMKFSNGANMRRHRMRHNGVKPYECRVCQKRKDHLAEHMATHSKLLPFRCPICNKGFQRQIAMRAHFQNEHVGGSHDMVKACPLCSYKAGSMKSLRVHFYSRHGIDLDNPMPHSPSLQGSSNGGSGSPGPCGSGNGEYSELAQALGFEDRDKSSDSSLIPSHFLVPQIEISATSPYPTNFSFTPDSSYAFTHDERHSCNGDSPPPSNVSPLSDSSSNIPSSSDLVVVKREVMDEQQVFPEQSSNSPGDPKPNQCTEAGEEVQDGPEDLSPSGSNHAFRSTSSSKDKCSSPSKSTKLSPLKSLLRDDYRKDSRNVGTNHKSTSNGSSSSGSIGTANSHNGRTGSSSAHSIANNTFPATVYDGEIITSSNTENSASPYSSFSRRGASGSGPAAIHQCVYCGIIFPDKTLYFLHKGCHSSPPLMWRCNICGESCTNVYDFNSHLLSKSHQ